MGKGNSRRKGQSNWLVPLLGTERSFLDVRNPTKEDSGSPGWARERKRRGRSKHSKERTGYLSPWQLLKWDVKL